MNDASRYPATVRIAHWLTVLAILAAYLVIELGEDEGNGGAGALQWHALAGLVVLALLVVRVPALVLGRVPPIAPEPARWTRWLAHATHLALYAFLLVQPLLGILELNFGGQPVTLPFAGAALPVLVAPDSGLEERVGELHEVLGEVFYWIIGLHVAAALWHHFVVRDDTLRRML